LILNFHKVVLQHIAGEVEIFAICHRERPYESSSERFLKIGPHLPKLLSNIQGLDFFGTRCRFLSLGLRASHMADGQMDRRKSHLNSGVYIQRNAR